MATSKELTKIRDFIAELSFKKGWLRNDYYLCERTYTSCEDNGDIKIYLSSLSLLEPILKVISLDTVIDYFMVAIRHHLKKEFKLRNNYEVSFYLNVASASKFYCKRHLNPNV